MCCSISLAVDGTTVEFLFVMREFGNTLQIPILHCAPCECTKPIRQGLVRNDATRLANELAVVVPLKAR